MRKEPKFYVEQLVTFLEKNEELAKKFSQKDLKVVADTLRRAPRTESGKVGTLSLPMKTYPLQKKLAERAVRILLRSSKDIVLISPMQSGKSGIVCEIARRLLGKRKVYYICAVAEINLTTQNKENFSAENIIMLDKMVLQKALNEGGTTAVEALIEPGSVVIFDEAHHGVTDKSVMYSIFRILVDDLKMQVVAVSATNFVFQYSRLGKKAALVAPTKEELETAKYRGPEQLLKYIVNVGGTCNPVKNERMFQEALDHLLSQKEPSIMLVRADQTFVKRYGPESGGDLLNNSDIDVVYWNQSNKTVVNLGSLKERPAKPTIIVVDDYLRMGKVIPYKQNIVVVFDNISYSTPIDTAIQGLVGRMCGYGTINKNLKIYTSLDRVTEYIAYINNGFKLSKRKEKRPYKPARKVTQLYTKVGKRSAEDYVNEKISKKGFKELDESGKYAPHYANANRKGSTSRKRFFTILNTEKPDLNGIYDKEGMIVQGYHEYDEDGPNKGLTIYKLLRPKTPEELRNTSHHDIAFTGTTIFDNTKDTASVKKGA